MRLAAAVVAALALASPASASKPPSWWVRSATCIHRYEGAWNANTGNGYYGGMQMDAAFERAYGGWAYNRWGHAHRWPIRVQLRVAYAGWLRRGWWPWPNTARYCGLL